MSNQRESMRFDPRFGLTPVTSGDWLPPKEKLVFYGMLNTRGRPAARVSTPLTCHWPNKASVHLCQPEPRYFPRPIGNSQLKLAMKRCGWSNEERERSQPFYRHFDYGPSINDVPSISHVGDLAITR